MINKKATVELYVAEKVNKLSLPVAEQGIKAGFPSPAQDFLDQSIDLNKELIKNPSATFYGIVSGDSMIDAGIVEGDIIVIDKSLEPRSGDIAVCYIDGEFTMKFIELEKDTIWLKPANENYKAIKVTADNEFMIWGIVTNCVKRFRR